MILTQQIQLSGNTQKRKTAFLLVRGPIYEIFVAAKMLDSTYYNNTTPKTIKSYIQTSKNRKIIFSVKTDWKMSQIHK